MLIGTPAEVDLTLRKGGDFFRRWEWHHDGVKQPLGNYTLHAEVRKFEGSTELLLDLRPYLSKVNDGIELAVPAPIINALTFNRAKWDLQLRSEIAGNEPLMAGDVYVKEAVTQ